MADILSNYPHPAYRRIAFARVLLESGEPLQNEIVVFDAGNQAVAHFPLCGEEAFVEWRNETFCYCKD